MNLSLLKEYIKLIIENKDIKDPESANDRLKDFEDSEDSEPVTDKSYSELLAELRHIGPAIPIIMATARTTKMCGVLADDVNHYLREKGFTTLPSGQSSNYPGRGHIDFKVLTSDKGWVSVDPTFIQFHCGGSYDINMAIENFMDKNNLEWEDIIGNKELINQIYEEEFRQILDYSFGATENGLDAFKITILGKMFVPHDLIQTKPPKITKAYYGYSSAQEKFEKNLKYLEMIKAGRYSSEIFGYDDPWIDKIVDYYNKDK